MLFNSLVFLLFFATVFVLYWFVFSRNAKTQNLLLLLASCFFYGYWNVWLLLLVIAAGTFTYWAGLLIAGTDEEQPGRKWMLRLFLLVELLVLCVFKYYNFFAGAIGNTSPGHTFTHLIFPLGLSFYTFSNISYLMDVYQGRMAVERNWLNLNLYTAYFPKIISGPIEKPGPFLGTISKKRDFDYQDAVDNLKLIVFGFFKKVVLADSVSPFVDNVFGNPSQYGAGVLLLTAFLYAFQIYADFSGYSDIARGVSGLLGIRLMVNFRFPFFATDISDFWRRWHISLSTWLNDYVFKPAAIEFRNMGRHGIFAAIVVTFFISGIWHGEGATYIVWGLLHALYYIPVIYGADFFGGITAGGTGGDFVKVNNLPKVFLTFFAVVFALIFFRAPNITAATSYLSGMVSFGVAYKKSPFATGTELIQFVKSVAAIVLLLALDSTLAWKGKLNNWVYYFLLMLIVFAGSYSNALNFIYFKF